MNGSEDEAMAVKALQMGTQDYLVKTWINKHLLARAFGLGAGGMKTLFQDGLANVFLGQTTLEEIARLAL